MPIQSALEQLIVESLDTDDLPRIARSAGLSAVAKIELM